MMMLIRNILFALRWWLLPIAGLLVCLVVWAVVAHNQAETVRQQGEVARQEDAKRQMVAAEQAKQQAAAALEQAKQQAAAAAEQARQDAEAAKERKAQAERDAAAKAIRNHEAYLERYLAERTMVNAPETREVAVLVVDQERRVDHEKGQAIASILQKQHINATSSLFTDKFAADGLLEKVLANEQGDIKLLDLASHVDELLFVKTVAKFSDTRQVAGLVTAKLMATFRTVDVATGRVLGGYALESTGVGSDNQKAEALAMERIMAAYTSRATTTPADGR